MAFGGLLGGDDSDISDIYGDLFTDKQKAALKRRELSQGLFRMSAALAEAAKPSPVPLGIGGLAASLGKGLGAFGSGGDEAMNKQLEAMSIAEKVRGVKSQRNFQEKYFDPLMLEWMRRRQAGLPAAAGAPGPVPGGGGGGGGGGGSSSYPGGPGAGPPPPAPLAPNPDMGDVSAKPLAPFGMSDTGDPLPPPAGPQRQTGLLPPPDQLAGTPQGQDIWAQLASFQQGGGALGGLPFDPAALGAGGPDVVIPSGPRLQRSDLLNVASKAEDDAWLKANAPDAIKGPRGPAHGWRYDMPTNIVPRPEDYGPGSPFGERPPSSGAPAPSGDDRLSQLMKVQTLAKPATGGGGGRAGVVEFWQGQGAPQHVAEGIADRVATESSFNPRAMGDSGTSGGLYQHHADRLTRLQEFAISQNKPWTDPSVQNQFAAMEVKGGDAIAAKGWPSVLAAPTREAAARLWDQSFERSAAGPGAGGRVNVRPLSGAAAPAGGAAPAPAASGEIPGLGINPEDLAMMNMLAKRSGLGEPFNSLLETYYKSPAYLMQAEAAKQLGGLPFEGPKAAAIAAAQQKYIQQNAANQSNLDIAKELLTKGGLVQMPDGSYKQITSIQEGLAAVENAKQTGDIKEYNFYKKQQLDAGQIPETFDKWDQSRRKASATTINTAEGLAAAEQKARIDLDKGIAEEAGKKALAARQLMPLLDEALVIARKTPESLAGAASVKLAQVASLFGIAPTPGQSNAELLGSINQRLIPMVREPGATAALEMDRYLAAGPGLMLTADGRVKIAEMTKALGQRAIEIAKVYRENMGKPDLYDKLAQFDRPLFTDEQRAAMDAAMNGAAPGAPPRITNDAAGRAAYDSLQSGTPFTDPTGATRIKP